MPAAIGSQACSELCDMYIWHCKAWPTTQVEWTLCTWNASSLNSKMELNNIYYIYNEVTLFIYNWILWVGSWWVLVRSVLRYWHAQSKTSENR